MAVRIPREQWDLPAGVVVSTGRLATLREVTDAKVTTASFPELSKKRQAAIVAARILRQESFTMWSIGGRRSKVSKRRAANEVSDRTPTGEVLIEIEGRVIAMLLAEVVERKVRRRGRMKAGAR